MSTILENTKGVHITSRGPYIGTYTGKKFYPLDIRESDIDIGDIAHALSNQCRFAGHVKEFYSVAQHCCLVSDYFLTDIPLTSSAWRGLLHDASEAYLVDVPRPIKQIANFDTYREIEQKTQRAIYHKFGIYPYEDPTWLHDADNLLLATEARDLMNDPGWCHQMPKAQMFITGWSPSKAKTEFMKRFNKLGKEIL